MPAGLHSLGVVSALSPADELEPIELLRVLRPFDEVKKSWSCCCAFTRRNQKLDALFSWTLRSTPSLFGPSQIFDGIL